jgi:hypothetical protein
MHAFGWLYRSYLGKLVCSVVPAANGVLAHLSHPYRRALVYRPITETYDASGDPT